jgi:hypothetical protein
MQGPLVRADSLAWARGGTRLTAVLEDGSAAAIDPFTARVVCKVEPAQLEEIESRPFERVEFLEVCNVGAAIVQGTRPFPRGVFGTHVPTGDEAPERGRNPGSAEPPPPMPRYIYHWNGRDLKRVWMASQARCIDTLWVKPDVTLRNYLFFQVANSGGARHGTPHVWLGRIDEKGGRIETDLGNPFAEGVDAPQFTCLRTDLGASKSLVFVRSNRIKRIKKELDAEMKKLLAENAGNAFHRDGKDAAMNMLAGALLMQRYGRSGCSEDGTHVIMDFAAWSLWVLDAKAGRMRQLGPEYGEAIGDLDGVVGVGGAPGSSWSGAAPVYSEKARAVTVVLEGSNARTPGRAPRGLMLISVPEW